MLRALALGLGLLAGGLAVRDIDGRPLTLLAPAPGRFDLLLFLSPDCPISNRYTPEIQRICADYAARGVRCLAVYPDAADVDAVKRHREEYGFPPSIPALLDRDHAIVRAVEPRVTPEVALYGASGRVYRGRIDDLYVSIGRSRRVPTRHDLRLALDAAVAGRPVAVAETEAVGCAIQTP
jgi:hypothetical protein